MAYKFPGTNSPGVATDNRVIVIPSTTALQLANDSSVELWANLINFQPNGYQAHTFILHRAGSDWQFYLDISSNSQSREGGYRTSQAGQPFGVGGRAPLNEWHHYAITRDSTSGAGVNLYQDGALIANPTGMGTGTLYSVVPTSNSFIGGSELDTEYSIEGYLDEVRVWNVARTQAEIKSCMYRRIAKGERGLVSAWRLDEDSGNTAYDFTKNSDGVRGNLLTIKPGKGAPLTYVCG